MPVYVYRNLNTGATFEVEQRITEAALTSDPNTGDPVRRVIQPVGIAFKGSGFYVTDSRGKNGATKNPAAVSKKPDAPAGDSAPPPAATKSAPAATAGD